MRAVMVELVLAALSATGSSLTTELPHTMCVFDTYVEVRHVQPFERASLPLKQRMTIVAGRTDEATRQLDGSIRATNSVQWTLVPLSDGAYVARVIGDDGEVLTLSRREGALGPLRGSFRASLVSSFSNDRTQTLLGTCVVGGR